MADVTEAIEMLVNEIGRLVRVGERFYEGSHGVGCLRMLELQPDRPGDQELIQRWFSPSVVAWGKYLSLVRGGHEEIPRMLESFCGIASTDVMAMIESVKTMRSCVDNEGFDVAIVGRSVFASRVGQWVAWIREDAGLWSVAARAR